MKKQAALVRRLPLRAGLPARCSDTLELACWTEELVVIGFVLDCCAREALAYVAQPRDLVAEDIRELMQRAVRSRFGGGRPEQSIQWLSDNGSNYIALETVCAAERLNLMPVTTPPYSPQSNGRSEAVVNTMRRDDIAGADRSTAAAVLEQTPLWFADYNAVAPHSALGHRSQGEYRRARSHIGSPG